MSIYDDLRQVSNDLHAEFKQGTISYVSMVVGAGARPDLPTSAAKGMAVPINSVARPVSTKYVDSTNVVMTDKQVSIPNDGVSPVPQLGHFIRIDGVDHKIIMSMARPAAGVPINWTVIVRK
jgi:hypothetical protein